ncbi:MAG: NAD(P)H-hydrate dehydratase [Xanthomonadales bacterium]|nr:NAD(P)H-hydrate dehydratase [Xanthomonadales bacterium]
MSELPTKLYTAEQVRALDACAIGDHGIAGFELMSRAGQALFDASRGLVPGARTWLVFCGAGNNAGDGYVTATLAAGAGLDVRVIALSPPDRLAGDAARAADAWTSAGGQVTAWVDFDRSAGADLGVDARLGTGLARPVGGAYAEAVDWINASGVPCVAADIPSGLDADTGRAMGHAVVARQTVTFIGLKRGLFTGAGPDHTGALVFAGLEVPDSVYTAIQTSGNLIDERNIRHYLKPRKRAAHKGDFGHLLVLGGDLGMPGAPRLCGEAGLRTGAGLVSILTHPDHAAQLNATRPELMVHGCTRSDSGKALIARATVLAMGPGLGTSAWSAKWPAMCVTSGLPAVLDADALNLLAAKQFQLPPGAWVLTPHPGEAARLLACDIAAVEQDRVGSAQAIAARYGAVAVLKGCGTVIAEPGGRYGICALGNPGMATAGSGDVLTGVIGALMAQGLDPWAAATTGVVVHAAAGDLAADRLGQRSLLAGDIIDHLHRVLR